MTIEITVEIKDYIKEVLLSLKRNKKYYEKGKKSLPIKYSDPSLYQYRNIKGKFLLCNKETGLPVIANPKTHGTPKVKIINGQKIYNGEISKWDRAKMIDSVKRFFKDHESLKKIKPISQYPIGIYYTFYDNFQNDPTIERKDLDNHAYIYGKCFQDVLVSEKIISEDSTEFVNLIQYKYVESDTIKLVIEIISQK